QSIQRAIDVLMEIARYSHEGLRMVDIANQLGLGRPTTHRIIKRLLINGLIMQKKGTRRYVLGRTLYELGMAAEPGFDFRGLFRPTLVKLAEETGDTAFLMIRSSVDAVCIDRVEGGF